MDFEKLERLEFSGIRGNALSQQVQQMHEEFEEMYKVFMECPYDCLDLQSMVGLGGVKALALFSAVSSCSTEVSVYIPFFLSFIFCSVVLVVLLFIDRVRRNCHPCVIRKILIILRAEDKNQKELLPPLTDPDCCCLALSAWEDRGSSADFMASKV